MPSLSEETHGAVKMLQPGATIGIIGGGQLGRMMALSAKYMGFRIGVLDPTPDCPEAPPAFADAEGGAGRFTGASSCKSMASWLSIRRRACSCRVRVAAMFCAPPTACSVYSIVSISPRRAATSCRNACTWDHESACAGCTPDSWELI